MKDLPGQTLMPFAEPNDSAAADMVASATYPAQGYCKGSAEDTQAAKQILPLPQKTTLSPPEAARMLGICARQVRYLVDEGTLLAIDVGRRPIQGGRDKNSHTPWRVVVRRGAEFTRPEFDAFLTLEEFILKRSNAAG